MARRLCPVDEPGAHRRIALDQSRCAAPHGARRAHREIRHHRAHGGGQGLVQPDLAPADAVAGFGAGPDPDQAEIHHRHPVKRHGAAVDRHGKALRTAVGHGARLRHRAPLQARRRDVPVGDRIPRLGRSGRGDDGGGAQQRPRARRLARHEDRLYRPALRTRRTAEPRLQGRTRFHLRRHQLRGSGGAAWSLEPEPGWTGGRFAEGIEPAMALEQYQRKRDFRKTPEPAGTAPRRKKPTAAPLSFVVQKHAARQLHYDFRLELNGVLLSWAVPRGPSLDPGEKRLAVHVEDHPIEYGGFEGVIPKGQYGGGTVLLWDRGSWTPLDPDPDAAYRKGSLKFRLDGEKLHGNWALVRMGGKAANERHENWLLIKERDAVAAPESGSTLVTDNPLSVATGRSMDAIAAERDRVWDSQHGGEIAGNPPAAPAPKRARKSAPAGARKGAMPERLAPQLASQADTAPDGPEWLHEIKYDGYRLLIRIERGEVRLITRGGLDWTGKFPALARALAALPVDSAWVDGEVVALAADGTTSFGELQDKIANGDTSGLVFFAFDLLYRDGYDLTGAALEDRKAALAEIVPRQAAGMVRYSDHQEGHGPDFFRHACRYDLEGTIAKRRDRPYRSGRSSDWRKMKCHKSDEFVVIGFTEPSGTRHGIGALILGYYDRDGRLHYAGRVGTGFNDRQLNDLRVRLDAIGRPDSPAPIPKGVSTKDVHWAEPRLVAEVRYSGWTDDAILRHSSFEGLREDKSAAEVVYGPPGVADNPHPPTADAVGPSLSRGAGEGKKKSAAPRTLSRTAGEGGERSE